MTLGSQSGISIFALFGRCCSYGFLPRCEMYNGLCGREAVLSHMMPSMWILPLRLAPKFACATCYVSFVKAWRTPMKGIDPPAGADEDWKPSLMEHLHHARIAFDLQNRDKHPPTAAPNLDNYWRNYEIRRGFTPAQREQSRIQRALILKFGSKP